MAPTGSKANKKTVVSKGRSSSSTVSKDKLLAIIAQVSSMHGGDGAPRDVVCLRAKYSGKPQGFSKAISRLSQSDHLRSVKGGLLVLTQKGLEVAGDVEPPAETNDDQIKEEREHLSGSQLTIFDLLLEAPSDARLERSV